MTADKESLIVRLEIILTQLETLHNWMISEAILQEKTPRTVFVVSGESMLSPVLVAQVQVLAALISLRDTPTPL